MGEEPRPRQTVRLKLKLCSPIPPVRAAYDQSQHDEFHRKHREHVARFTEQGERISDDDARALVHLWLDLDLSDDPEWARDYYVGMLASSLGPLDGTPREEVVDLFAERSRTSALHWDVLDWVLMQKGGKYPLGQTLQRWVAERGQRPRASEGSRGPEPKMAERNYVIAWAVYILKKCGMNVMRNELTERASACDIVAGVLADRNQSVSKYSSVLAIWQSKR